MPNTETIQQSTEPISTTPQPSEDTTPLRLLPEAFYCPGCGEHIVETDLNYNADISGKQYGSALIEAYDLNNEVNDEDYSSENHVYTCIHCDREVDAYEAQRMVVTLNELIDRNALPVKQQNKLISEYLAQNTYDQRNALYRIIPRTHTGLFLRIENRNTGETHLVFHPQLLEIVKTQAESDVEFACNLTDPIYTLANTLYETLLQKAIEFARTSITYTNGASEHDVLPQILNEQRDAIRFFQLNSRGSRIQRQSNPDDDPLNSNVFEPSNHRRWHDTDLSDTRECTHCHHVFVCDHEFDTVPCPKCNKETLNT